MIHGQKSPISSWTNLETFFCLSFLWNGGHASSYQFIGGKKGLSTASEAEKSFREGGSFISFSFSFVLTFSPLAVGQPGLGTQEESRSLFRFLLLVLSQIRTTCSLTELHFPQSPGRAEGGCQGQAKLLLPDRRRRPLDSFSATVLHNK